MRPPLELQPEDDHRLCHSAKSGKPSLLENTRRNATVVARERVEAYTLAKDGFLKAQVAFESMREELMKEFAQRSCPE